MSGATTCGFRPRFAYDRFKVLEMDARDWPICMTSHELHQRSQQKVVRLWPREGRRDFSTSSLVPSRFHPLSTSNPLQSLCLPRDPFFFTLHVRFTYARENLFASDCDRTNLISRVKIYFLLKIHFSRKIYN